MIGSDVASSGLGAPQLLQNAPVLPIVPHSGQVHVFAAAAAVVSAEVDDVMITVAIVSSVSEASSDEQADTDRIIAEQSVTANTFLRLIIFYPPYN
jgi:hypothetical protein